MINFPARSDEHSMNQKIWGGQRVDRSEFMGYLEWTWGENTI